MTDHQPEKIYDADALDAIADILRKPEWDSGTIELVADVVARAGYNLDAVEPISWADEPTLTLDVYDPESLADWMREHPHNRTQLARIADYGPCLGYTATGPLADVRELLADQWDAALYVDKRGRWALDDLATGLT